MRVRQVEPGRRRGSVCIQPQNAEATSLHHEWFDEAYLVPLEKETRADFKELLKSYLDKKRRESS